MSPNLPTHPRSWGTRFSTSPPNSPASAVQHEEYRDVSGTELNKQKEDKLPHDASVFVGSLPSNIDQVDLTRMLMDHLSEHTQIKNIKVVRDSKGGVCAFVQCENASAATALIQTLHSSAPKPFLGRILRYEPARAFRTLLISYRAPTQLVRSAVNSRQNDPTASNEIALELPDAMRIGKQRNSRFHSILYNTEAVEAEDNCDRSDVSITENVVFLQPVRFDGQTLRKLASYFGRLESFKPLQVPFGSEDDLGMARNEEVSLEYASYPIPHNAPRSRLMEEKCWEIKWDHRDDCVSALMTLRRVPHLTVTWAHQPTSSGHSIHPSQYSTPGSASYPLHVQDQIGAKAAGRTTSTTTSTPRLSLGSPSNIGNGIRNAMYYQHRLEYDLHRHPIGPQTPSPSPGRYTAHDSTKESGHLEVTRDEGLTSSTSNLSWLPDDHASVATLTTKQDMRAYTNHETEDGYGDNLIRHPDQTENTPEHPDEVQELYMPQTPALDSSSITPITPGSQFPTTPTSCDDMRQDTSHKTFGSGGDVLLPKDPRTGRELDPTTLFVGGLEMFGPGAWDEEKVKTFFARFGGLESVKVVRPLNSCAAFAFVKFDNAESPARAVFEEHNRVYEGRAMRVQLRDCNPPRSPWKFGRGRGRLQQPQFGIQRRFTYRPTHDGQKTTIPGIRQNSLTLDDNDSHGGESQLSAMTASLSVMQKTSEAGDSPGSVTSGNPTTPDLSSNANITSQTENYREWYDEPASPAHTPEPLPFGPSVSATGTPYTASTFPYPLPNAPYFPQTHWIHPYAHQTPYQIPFYGGYPVYPAQQPTQSLTSPPSSDASGPAAIHQNHWPQMSMYGSYVQYPVLPQRTQVVDPGLAQHLNSQAPLVPTGFIQNEQGTLIAVYQPEALDQYLAGAGGTPIPPSHYSQNNTLQRGVPAATTHPYDTGSSLVNIAQTTNQGRAQIATSFPTIRPQVFGFPQPQVPLRGSESTFNSPAPPYRRQGARREPQHNFSPSRNHTRSIGGRPSRPHVHNSALGNPPDHMLHPTMIAGQWNSANPSR
ncbi:hypothetical protein B0H34DRAFT_792378 [Crassisporium funariophilum]|nr:hypothetical protein B0H34DRAFT_792378 [Crassisporium funariophilum]